jgi:molybdenum-dependent DNA-binding transcriptional regulator ModE
MREYLSEGERSILLKVKSYYDKVGTISGVAKILDMQPWRVRKYLRKGHRYGLFNFDKFDRRSKIVRKKRSRNFSRVIKIGQNRFTLEELLRLIKEHGSLRKVSSITGIQYVRLYSIVTKRFGKGISQLKKEIKLVKVKDRSFSYSIKKIIRLFKKYGFLPYVSKLTGIPSYHLRKILTKEFGMGLFELRKKLGVRRAYLKRRAIERNVTRYQQVRQVYERTGTLRKAAKELNLSAERVRQILTSGKKLGIFDYETRGEYFKRLKHDLKRDDLIKEIKLLNLI